MCVVGSLLYVHRKINVEEWRTICFDFAHIGYGINFLVYFFRVSWKRERARSDASGTMKKTKADRRNVG